MHRVATVRAVFRSLAAIRTYVESPRRPKVAPELLGATQSQTENF